MLGCPSPVKKMLPPVTFDSMHKSYEAVLQTIGSTTTSSCDLYYTYWSANDDRISRLSIGRHFLTIFNDGNSFKQYGGIRAP
jgi:hypothetical protein